MWSKLTGWIGDFFNDIWSALADWLQAFASFLWGIILAIIEWFFGGIWYILKFFWEQILRPIAQWLRQQLNEPFTELWQSTGVSQWFEQGGFIGTFINVGLIFDSIAICAVWLLTIAVGKFTLRLIPTIG